MIDVQFSSIIKSVLNSHGVHQLGQHGLLHVKCHFLISTTKQYDVMIKVWLKQKDEAQNESMLLLSCTHATMMMDDDDDDEMKRSETMGGAG